MDSLVLQEVRGIMDKMVLQDAQALQVRMDLKELLGQMDLRANKDPQDPR